jgi:hypothetical protein
MAGQPGAVASGPFDAGQATVPNPPS